MDNKKEVVKKKKKSPIPLIVSLVVVLGIFAFVIAEMGGADLTAKWKHFLVRITGEEPKNESEPGKNGEDVVVTDEKTLREMLEREGTLSIVITKDVFIKDTLVVNGSKTLSGTKSIIKNLDAPERGAVCSVSEKSKLTIEGVTIDANGASNGVEVKTGAELKVVSGKVLYGMPYGIITAGTVEIDDITVDNCLHTGIYADNAGKVYMNGGKITNTVIAAIATATSGYAKISGDSELRHSDQWLVYNFGTMDITGGKLCDSGTDSNIIQNKGILNIISDTEDYVEICDAGRSGISSVNSTTLNIDGLYVHDVKSQSMNIEKNSVGSIRNCIVENTGTKGFYFGASKVSIQDVTIKNSGKQAAIEIAKDAVADVSNIKISDGNHRGIVVNNGKGTIKNVDIRNMAGAGIVTSGKDAVAEVDQVTIDTVGKSGLGITGGTINARNVTIKNAAGDGINITKECKVTLANMNVSASGKRGLYIAKGSADLKNSVIDGSKQPCVYLEKNTTINLTGVTVKNAGTHGIGNYGGTLNARNLTIDGANNGGVMSKGGAVNCDTTCIANTKSRAVNIAENCRAVMKGLTILNAGGRGIYVEASKAEISNFTVDHVAKDFESVMAAKSAKVTLKDGQINAAGVGLSVDGKSETLAENVKVLRNKGNNVLTLSNVQANSKLTMNGADSRIDGNGSNGRAIKVVGTFIFNAGKICNNQVAGSKYDGAGVYVDKKGTFIMNGGSIERCVGTSDGAAVHIAETGRFQLNAGTIQNNYTPDGCGGAVSVRGTFDMKGGTVQNNSARLGGGFIVRVTGKLTMTGGTVKGNSAVCAGAGVMTQSTNTTISGGMIEENTTTGTPGSSDDTTIYGGAGIYVHTNGSLTLEGGTIQKNKAAGNGGGIYIATTADGATNTITGGKIAENEAVHGGGMYLDTAKSVTMTDMTIEGNKAAGNGGGVNVVRTYAFTMTGGTISGNTAVNGGGVATKAKGVFTMEGGQIQNNQVVNADGNGLGAGVYVGATTANKPFTMTGGTISGHGSASAPLAKTQGAGVYVVKDATFTMDKDAVIEDNHVTAQAGAGVRSDGIVNLKGGIIQKNSTTTNGGGILITGNGTLNMTGGTVKGNSAGNAGAGVMTQSKNTTIAGGTIESNVTTISKNNGTNGGAGIYVHKAGALAMNGGTVQNNISASIGGGIYIATENVADNTIAGVTVKGNQAVDGAGLYMKSNKNLTLSEITIEGNTATGNGGGIYQDGNVTINSGEVSANRSTKNGGGIYITRGKEITIKDGKIINNTTANNNGAGIHADGENKINLTGKGTINGNDAGTATVQGVFLQESKANSNTSQVVLHTTFTMGNEIRFNNLAARGKEDPILIIKGSIPDGYKLPLGFHNSAAVYIQCDSADIATGLVTIIKDNQFKTAWSKFSTDGSYIKASK